MIQQKVRNKIQQNFWKMREKNIIQNFKNLEKKFKSLNKFKTCIFKKRIQT